MAPVRTRTRLALALVAAAALAALALDVHTPAVVAFEPTLLEGVPAERAEGLVLQQEEPGEVWASRGYAIYRSRNGGDFEKVVTVLPRFGEAWAGFSATLRRAFGYQELVEVLPLSEDLLIAFAGGDIHRIDLSNATQERVAELRFFGRGQGRGVMAHGLTEDDRGRIYYGEYATGPGYETRTARIWRSDDQGRSFEVAFEFAPGAVRHIHGVQWDPVGRAIWVSTGDRDAGSRIGFSRDGAKSFEWIGENSQDYRACSLLFLEPIVAWGMDADHSVASVLRWPRTGGLLARASPPLPAPAFYSRVLDAGSGLVGLAEGDAGAYFVGLDGPPLRVFSFSSPVPRPSGPHPVLRLARASHPAGSSVYLNPLRTIEENAAIFRIPKEAILERAARMK